MRKILGRLTKPKSLQVSTHKVMICTDCGEIIRRCNCAQKEMCSRE
jgi:Fe2+ or Zn2+ uptake regulation protein